MRFRYFVPALFILALMILDQERGRVCARPCVVTFELIGIYAALVNRMALSGNSGRNTIRLLDGAGAVRAGMYFVKMTAGRTSRVVPMTIQ